MLLSLVAEPLTGLADTAFVARLGAEPLAALGVGTIVLSSVFWIWNFLGIGTQTEVAQAEGAGDAARSREVCGLALGLAASIGLAMIVVGFPLIGPVAAAMGAGGAVHAGAATYLRWRLVGAPAVILTTVGFGALRGLQEMRVPLAIAVVVNLLNVGLDALLIFGFGPLPPLGIAGAAAATTASQWAGAIATLVMVRRRLPWPASLRWADAGRLLVVGRDLFIRTGLLTTFLLLQTRAATRGGAEAGAAHQAIRQVWVFTALLLDAWAATAQSLVGYFMGAARMAVARRVAAVACGWSLATGSLLAAAMILLARPVATLFVPPAAHGVFHLAWAIAAVTQPLSALSFATDGIHWGTRDYGYLRNAMLVATAAGAGGLALVAGHADQPLTAIWVVTGVWIAIRAVLGVARIWPALGASPWRRG